MRDAKYQARENSVDSSRALPLNLMQPFSLREKVLHSHVAEEAAVQQLLSLNISTPQHHIKSLKLTDVMHQC